MTKTEKILILLDSVAVILTAMAVVLSILGRDVMYLEALAGAWITAAGVFHVLYCRKESRANSQKYMELWVEKVADKYGPDYAAKYAEIVLQNSDQ